MRKPLTDSLGQGFVLLNRIPDRFKRVRRIVDQSDCRFHAAQSRLFLVEKLRNNRFVHRFHTALLHQTSIG